MIDPKVFAELQNHGIITNVGLNAEDFNGIDDLQNRGFATSIATNPVYDKLTEVPADDETDAPSAEEDSNVVVDDDATVEA